MLTNRTLQRINNRPRNVNRLPLLAVGGGSLALVAPLYVFEILPPLAILAVVSGGALLVLLLYASQVAKTTISLSYKGNLDDDEVASRFSEVQRTLEDLASSDRVWSLGARGRRPYDAAETVPTPRREPARVGLLSTPGIKADVPVWGIEGGEGTVFFFPEGTLYYKNDRYEPVPYNSLNVAFYSGRFFEEEGLPDDAKVVDSTWRFSRPDGSPDPRYKQDNVKIPIVMYGLLGIKGPSGLNMRLMASDRQAALRFARTFGADVSTEQPKGKKAGRADNGSGRYSSEEGQEERCSAEDLEREARLATARKTLGVAKGASAEQIGAAYRELARIHHPDKVAHLEPEVREYSEQRMKEINAAYAEFKRQWNDQATEDTRVG